MPTLLMKNGFKFFFYANEHEPKHIHVIKADEYAKINLSDTSVVNCKMKPKNIKMALDIVEINKTVFIGEWDDWFSKR